jgi:hypothetical protein
MIPQNRATKPSDNVPTRQKSSNKQLDDSIPSFFTPEFHAAVNKRFNHPNAFELIARAYLRTVILKGGV